MRFFERLREAQPYQRHAIYPPVLNKAIYLLLLEQLGSRYSREFRGPWQQPARELPERQFQ